MQSILHRLELSIDEQLISDIDLLMNQIIGFAQSPNNLMLVATPTSSSMLAYQQVEKLTAEVEQDVLNETIEVIGIVLEQDIIIAIIADDRAVSYSVQKLLESFNFRAQVFNSIDEFLV
ncbi:MAG: hypothetical protein P8J70_00935 [Glaciecola sp.]|nr:hypothetical protein [Glaciecola sp.]MDG1816895.1 hypothetical protein [Glaciecola sp.]MDG2098228.1 hypothetical protein [Glaciecola sp.]